MKLKILSLIMRIQEAEFLVLIAKHLETYDVQMEFVAGHESACDVFRKSGLKYYNIHEMSRQTGNITGCSSKHIKDIQNKFKIDNIRDLYMREKLHLRQLNEDKMLQKTLVYLKIMDEIVEECNPDIVVQETGDFVAPICLYYAAKARNVNHIFIEPAMFPKRIAFVLNSLYADIPPEIMKSQSSEVELNLANEYMQKYIDNKTVRIPVKDKIFFKDMSFRKIVTANNFRRLSRKLFHKYIARESEEYNAIGWHCMWHIIRVIRRKLLNRFYIAELPDKPYIYFPLHVLLDLQLTTRCPEYLDQLALVEYISRCLPYGYSLLIKEHPASIGAYSYRRIKKILDQGNHVQIVHPGMNSYDIVENSECVITINSKVGVEAIVQQKPVVTLGPAFYRDKGLTIDVNNLRCLPKAIRKALDSGKLDPKKVGEFLAKVHKWSWPGELFDNSSENIEQFSESLLGVIKKNNVCKLSHFC
jgi:hypothetical protein